MCLRDDLLAFCDLCRTECDPEFLEPVDVFPMRVACGPCRAELLADEEDPRENVCDLCGNGGCEVCLGLPSRVGM